MKESNSKIINQGHNLTEPTMEKTSSNTTSSSNKSISLDECYVMKKTRLIRQKTPEEVKFLEEQFSKDPSWSRKTVQYWKDVLNLGTTQIYKWGFDKKLSLERKEKQRYPKKDRNLRKIKNKLKRKKSTKGKRRSKKAPEGMRGRNKKQISKPLVCQIDYNKEVNELMALYNNQCKSEDERMSDDSDQNDKKENRQSKQQDWKGLSCSNSINTYEDPRPEEQRKNSSSVPNSWLDELWDESFDPCQYLSSSSDLVQDPLSLMNSEYIHEDLPMSRLSSINKALNIESSNFLASSRLR